MSVMTNAEKIRGMSDEELADLLTSKVFGWMWCDPNAPVEPETKDCLKYDGDCLQCCKDWLIRKSDG